MFKKEGFFKRFQFLKKKKEKKKKKVLSSEKSFFFELPILDFRAKKKVIA